MDTINLILLISLVLSFIANIPYAQKGLKSNIIKVKEKPSTFLQSYPANTSAVILIFTVVSVFGTWTLTPEDIKGIVAFETLYYVRVVFLGVYILSLIGQYIAIKELGASHSQEILIYNNHKLVTSGIYKILRHPQYLFQILGDIAAGISLLSYIILPIAIIIELPLFFLRAKFEDKLLEKHFKGDYANYEKKTGSLLPFIG